MSKLACSFCSSCVMTLVLSSAPNVLGCQAACCVCSPTFRCVYVCVSEACSTCCRTGMLSIKGRFAGSTQQQVAVYVFAACTVGCTSCILSINQAWTLTNVQRLTCPRHSAAAAAAAGMSHLVVAMLRHSAMKPFVF